MTEDPTLPRLSLHIRAGCHLCEDMHAQLLELRREIPFELQLSDVDRDPELVRRYGTKVPVLEANGREICHYYLDLAGLREYLSNPGNELS